MEFLSLCCLYCFTFPFSFAFFWLILLFFVEKKQFRPFWHSSLCLTAGLLVEHYQNPCSSWDTPSPPTHPTIQQESSLFGKMKEGNVRRPRDTWDLYLGNRRRRREERKNDDGPTVVIKCLGGRRGTGGTRRDFQSYERSKLCLWHLWRQVLVSKTCNRGSMMWWHVLLFLRNVLLVYHVYHSIQVLCFGVKKHIIYQYLFLNMWAIYVLTQASFGQIQQHMNKNMYLLGKCPKVPSGGKGGGNPLKPAKSLFFHLSQAQCQPALKSA